MLVLILYINKKFLQYFDHYVYQAPYCFSGFFQNRDREHTTTIVCFYESELFAFWRSKSKGKGPVFVLIWKPWILNINFIFVLSFISNNYKENHH